VASGEDSVPGGADEVEDRGDVIDAGVGVEQGDFEPGSAVDGRAGDGGAAGAEEDAADERDEFVGTMCWSAVSAGVKRKSTVDRSEVPEHLEVGLPFEQLPNVGRPDRRRCRSSLPISSAPRARSVVQSLSASKRRVVCSDLSTWFGSASAASASASGLR
jgi:hypothetical protein